MAQRSKVWRAAAVAFIGINLAGAIYAVVVGEPMHAAYHAVALAVGFAVYSLVRSDPATADAVPQETAERLKNLEESVDALAIGVERIGEAQRYQTKILNEKSKASPPTKKDA